MKQNSIQISDNFRRMAWQAVGSIALFVLVYLFLIVLAIGLTALCSFAGIMLIALHPSFITLMIGGGLISMGILVIFFLVKFVFKKHTVDRSHLLEITEAQQPQIFGLIGEIVAEVKTDFPKKVYFSSDVNAAVFYDSSFWSMFFPVKKNLQIGVGLLNAVSVSELKAILAHEFGHFSQRSMKVGSYVYNVNQVIYNLLFDNDSYGALIQRWADVSGYFAFFAGLAVRIISGIQWILKKVYAVVNLNYMALSREMEFHADEVAAHVAGSAPLVSSLLRLDLADQSFNTVLDYYNRKIAESVKTDNLYPQHQFVMNFLAKASKFSVENELPQISPEQNSRFNQSKLTIKDQWASHPSTPDRIEQLRRLAIDPPSSDHRLAATLLLDKAALQGQMTNKLFESVTYPGTPTDVDTARFIEEYTKEYRENAFDEIYSGYYDRRNPGYFDLDTVSKVFPEPPTTTSRDVFNEEALDLVHSAAALESDLATLKQIHHGEAPVKTFDYDGQKYFRSDCQELVPKLEAELGELKRRLRDNDVIIFRHFLSIAQSQSKEEELLEKYRVFFEVDKAYDQKFEAYSKMVQATDFFNHTTPFELIEKNLVALNAVEIDFKAHIEQVLKEENYQAEITSEIRERLTNYGLSQCVYFNKTEYDRPSLDVLSEGMHAYSGLLSKTYFKRKKDLLDYQVKLEPQYQLLST